MLSEQKRVRLVMQVFHSADIVRDESVAVAKFRVWWHFVVALRDKAAALFAEVYDRVVFSPVSRVEDHFPAHTFTHTSKET